MSNKEPLITYVDGEFILKPDATVPVTDAGYKYGYALMDALRTFDGDPVFIDDYLDRIERSAEAMELEIPLSTTKLRTVIDDVIDANRSHLSDNADFIVLVYISGIPPGRTDLSQTVVVEPTLIPFAENARKFISGARVSTATSDTCHPVRFHQASNRRRDSIS